MVLNLQSYWQNASASTIDNYEVNVLTMNIIDLKLSASIIPHQQFKLTNEWTNKENDKSAQIRAKLNTVYNGFFGHVRLHGWTILWLFHGYISLYRVAFIISLND